MMMLVVDVHNLSFHGFHDLEECSFYNAVSRHCLTHWQALWPTRPFKKHACSAILKRLVKNPCRASVACVLPNLRKRGGTGAARRIWPRPPRYQVGDEIRVMCFEKGSCQNSSRPPLPPMRLNTLGFGAPRDILSRKASGRLRLPSF